MALDSWEHHVIASAGTTLLPIAEPEDYDREDVPYPLGLSMDPSEPGIVVPLFDKDNPYEPLAAGLGRYIMVGACGNLKETAGWERCGNYQGRPNVCRDFEPGGDKCRELRRNAGLETPPIDRADQGPE